MCGCGQYETSPEGMADKVKHQKEDVIRENMSLVEERLAKGSGPLKSDKKSPMVHDYDEGFSLHVNPNDPDAMHIEYHEGFLAEFGSKLRPQAKARMKLHIEKHKVQKKLKEGY